MDGGPYFVYVANGDGTIMVFRMASAEREPEYLETVPITAEGLSGGLSTPMALSPDQTHLYAAVRAAPLPLTTFSIDRTTGHLEPVGTARLPASTPYLVTDRTGHFLFSAANIGATVAVSSIDDNGHVAPYAHQVLHISHKLHCVVVDAGNAHVYVSSTDDGVIHVFEFDADAGRLAPADLPAVKLNNNGDPRHMVFSPDGQFLYVTTEAGGRVACFSVDAASGNLTELPDAPMMPDDFSGRPMTADIHITPDGRFLYASERILNTITCYGRDEATGALTFFDRVSTEPKPRAFAISPDGSFMLVAGQDSGQLSAYALDGATGKLTKGVEIAAGLEPNWIEFVEPA